LSTSCVESGRESVLVDVGKVPMGHTSDISTGIDGIASSSTPIEVLLDRPEQVRRDIRQQKTISNLSLY
jgi:hypothetical protein